MPAASLPRVPAHLLPVASSPWWCRACAVPIARCLRAAAWLRPLLIHLVLPSGRPPLYAADEKLQRSTLAACFMLCRPLLLLCPVTPLLRCDPRMGATTVSSMDGHIWRWAGNIPPGFEPEFEPRLAHYSKCYTYTWFGSALQNTYISSLGHDDASSDSFPTRRSRISA